MLDVTTAAWAATIGVIVALLAADLALSARTPHAVSFRAAVVQSLFYIGVAIAFGVAFGSIFAPRSERKPTTTVRTSPDSRAISDGRSRKAAY